MNPTRLLRSRVFRLTLVSTLLFAAIAAGVIALLYRSSTQAVSRQIEATIEAEIAGLAEQYAQLGTGGLINVINRRSSSAGRTGGIYLLASEGGRPLAGNLNRWPNASPNEEGWIRFSLRSREDGRGEILHAKARVFRLGNGMRLLVGHDTGEHTRITSLVEDRLLWAGLIAIVLAVAFGALLSWLILRRIDAITATSREITGGDLSRRIPVTRSDDEFDRLANSRHARTSACSAASRKWPRTSRTICAARSAGCGHAWSVFWPSPARATARASSRRRSPNPIGSCAPSTPS